MTGRVFDLLLIFLATILGILTYYAARPAPVVGMLVVLFLAALALRLVAFRVLGRPDPSAVRLTVAAICVFVWYGALFAVIALITWAVLGATFALVALLKTEGGVFQIPDGEVGTIRSLTIGALTALIGGLFYDDVKDSDSALWPPAMFKAYLAKVYGKHPGISGRKTPELYDALFQDKTAGGIAGWGPLAALRRVIVIVRHLPGPRPRN